jgi:tRNA threonylcarbamoyladenosine modification (KEOPS) complex  Pcc1 subunit
MKKIFEDNSYIEIKLQDDKITIIIQAKDYENPLKKITNSVVLDFKDFVELVSDISNIKNIIN